MNAKNITRRVRNIRTDLSSRGIDALVLTRPANVTYVTGFFGEDSWAVVTGRAVYLLTDSRYTEQAQKECPLARIVQRKDPIAEAGGKLLGKRKLAKTIAVEKSISLGEYDTLRKNMNVPLKAVDGLVETQRSVKDAQETAAIRSAAAIAATAFQRAVRHIRPGMTESELAGILDLEMRRQGAKVGFETIVAFGPNASRPHHQPSPRKLASRDTILIDFGAKYNGYCCDITRSFAFGRPTAAYRQAYEVVEEAQAAAIRAAKAGAKLVDVDAAARNAIRESGLPVYGHGTGHGFGLEIHEIPFLKEGAKGELQAGQIITIEPGIYLPGRLGVRIEDDLLITESGPEILTDRCPRGPALA
ncbi:MAG: Xaa-Pro peptidase family protein [Planctomycetes bacterium]|nr:Xaa-Pro peptidase family protein [Planctomycetota bacterium]